MKIGIHPNFNNLLDGNFSLGRSKNKAVKKIQNDDFTFGYDFFG